AERGDCFEPCRRRAVLVELALFFFRRGADLALHCRIADRYKMPRLQIRAIRRSAGGANAMLNHFARDWPIGELADRAASLHARMEIDRAPDDLLVRCSSELRSRNEMRLSHTRGLTDHVRQRDSDCLALRNIS